MITYTGKQVFPRHSEYYTGEAPTIIDIAVGLGRQSRFAGQTAIFYTVLCHSLVCAKLVEQEYKIHALLHDAAEAIVSDVPSTWKYQATVDDEHQILELVYADLGLEWPPSDKVRTIVKAADSACLAAESHALGHSQAERWWPRESFGDLESEAYDETMRMLQLGMPIVLLRPEYAITEYQRAVLDALGNDGQPNNLIASINEALK